jgi:hypothetical protein
LPKQSLRLGVQRSELEADSVLTSPDHLSLDAQALAFPLGNQLELFARLGKF